MSQFELNLNTTVLGRSQAGLVYTQFWIRLDDFDFPASGWTDFTVVVLSWWAEAASRLISHQREHQELRFMDGPYAH
jgi:hypothetical protein